MADGGGIEPPHPCGLGALATRCLTSRPTVRGWRKRQESNLQGLAARTVFGTGPLANRVCASMWVTTFVGAPRWIRTSNLRVLSAAPLPIGLQGQFWDWDGRARHQRATERPLSVNSVSVYLVGIGSRIGP